MFDLKRKLLALVLVIGCLLPVGVYAQDKRPPKDDKNRVVVEPKGQRPPPPPPSNNNQGNTKKGKP
jgi:hypothetical protein